MEKPRKQSTGVGELFGSFKFKLQWRQSLTSTTAAKLTIKCMTTAPSVCQSLMALPPEIRFQIYSHLFSTSFGHTTYTIDPSFPFGHPAGSLLLISKALLQEITSWRYSKATNLTFIWPQSFTFWSLARPLLSNLTTLHLTIPAYQTQLLEPLFAGLLKSSAPVSHLSIRLRPTYPGVMSQPTPLYLLPRFDCSSKDWVQSHLPATIERAAQGKASLGKLKEVRYLKISGQPEFDESGFSLAVVSLYERMCEIAEMEGMGMGVIVEVPRVRSGEFVFEARIGEIEVVAGKEVEVAQFASDGFN